MKGVHPVNKTVVISGAFGYFGGIATQYFTEQGWRVIKAGRRHEADLKFNLDEPERVAGTSLLDQADLFIHAAAAHEVTCRQDPYQSIYQNVSGTRAALDFCVRNGIQCFVYVSTFHVFGNPIGVLDEDTTPLPLDDYGITHLQAEQYVAMYARKYGIKVLIVRPSNLFGLPANLDDCKRWTLVPLAFCKEALDKGTITLRTPGYQNRNYVSIRDLCRAIELVHAAPASRQILHVPGKETLSVRNLAYMIKEVVEDRFQRKIEVIVPEGAGDAAKFTFSSLWLHDYMVPSDCLKDYIAEFYHVYCKGA